MLESSAVKQYNRFSIVAGSGGVSAGRYLCRINAPFTPQTPKSQATKIKAVNNGLPKKAQPVNKHLEEIFAGPYRSPKAVSATLEAGKN